MCKLHLLQASSWSMQGHRPSYQELKTSSLPLSRLDNYLSHAVGQAESAKEFSESAKVIEILNKYRNKMKVFVFVYIHTYLFYMLLISIFTVRLRKYNSKFIWK